MLYPTRRTKIRPGHDDVTIQALVYVDIFFASSISALCTRGIPAGREKGNKISISLPGQESD
jgi:hypothetical protein